MMLMMMMLGLPLSASVCLRLPRSASLCRCLPLSAFVCFRLTSPSFSNMLRSSFKSARFPFIAKTGFSVDVCGMFLCTTLLSGGALRRQLTPPHRRSWSSPYTNPSFPQRHAAFDAQRWRAFAGGLFFAEGTRQSMHHVRNAACAMSPPTPLWLYRICHGDGGDLEEGPPLLGDPVGHRRQVLDAVSNGSHKRSSWLHWTLCKWVAAKYRERGRDQYGDNLADRITRKSLVVVRRSH